LGNLFQSGCIFYALILSSFRDDQRQDLMFICQTIW